MKKGKLFNIGSIQNAKAKWNDKWWCNRKANYTKKQLKCNVLGHQNSGYDHCGNRKMTQ